MTAVTVSKARPILDASRAFKKFDRVVTVKETSEADQMDLKDETCKPMALNDDADQAASSQVASTVVVAGTRMPTFESGKSRSVIARAMLAAVHWYQVHISAGNPPCCKYYPSCSNYAIQAVTRYGAVRGGLLAILRLLRCRPWSNGGIDDVPQHYSIFYRFSWSKAHEEPRLTPLVSDVKETA